MTGLTASHLLFPGAAGREPGVRGVRESFELVFVAVFTTVTADVFVRLVQAKFGRADGRRPRGVVVVEPTNRGYDKYTDRECFDESIQSSALPSIARSD